MRTTSSPLISRRALLSATAGFAFAKVAGRSRSATASPGPDFTLTAAPGRAQLTGADRPRTAVWTYSDSVPGPILRLRQGEPVRIVVDNKLEQDTTVHWHGIRLPIDMDGVPGISQPPIQSGETFVYEFTPPDAGTFWYHPHANSLQQLGRGLAGPLIVEEREPPPFDRELVWMIMDWRLGADGQIAAGFGNMMEAGMAGRIGNTVTINGVVPADEPIRAGERVRIRLINGALARIMALRFQGHRPVVVAIDGQPCAPHEPTGGRLLLGPAMRIDVVLDMQGEPGRRYSVIDDFYDGIEYALTHLAYSTAPPVRAHPPGAPLSLPRNPLPEPDLKTAERRELLLQGGMMGRRGMRMGGMGMGRAVWAINDMSMTGDGHAGMPPLTTLQLGRSYIVTLRNDTAWWHPIHLHGHSFRVLHRNGEVVPHSIWSDTVLLAPQDLVDIAFVADNPGDWMVHCHVTDHQTAGMMAVIRIGDGLSGQR
jgi:FtsP/CotA-like multicopper oxidase with cupredoxin domain